MACLPGKRCSADAVNWKEWHFEIGDMEGKTIDKVLATRIRDPDAAADEAKRPRAGTAGPSCRPAARRSQRLQQHADDLGVGR